MLTVACFHFFISVFLQSDEQSVDTFIWDICESICCKQTILYAWSSALAIGSMVFVLNSCCQKKNAAASTSDLKQIAQFQQPTVTDQEDLTSLCAIILGAIASLPTPATATTKESFGKRTEEVCDVNASSKLKNWILKTKSTRRNASKHRKRHKKTKHRKKHKKKDRKYPPKDLQEDNESYPKPRKFIKGPKEKLIAKGCRAGQQEYKTMDDVASDWGSESDDREEREVREKTSNATSTREGKRKVAPEPSKNAEDPSNPSKPTNSSNVADGGIKTDAPLKE